MNGFLEESLYLGVAVILMASTFQLGLEALDRQIAIDVCNGRIASGMYADKLGTCISEELLND